MTNEIKKKMKIYRLFSLLITFALLIGLICRIMQSESWLTDFIDLDNWLSNVLFLICCAAPIIYIKILRQVSIEESKKPRYRRYIHFEINGRVLRHEEDRIEEPAPLAPIIFDNFKSDLSFPIKTVIYFVESLRGYEDNDQSYFPSDGYSIRKIFAVLVLSLLLMFIVSMLISNNMAILLSIGKVLVNYARLLIKYITALIKMIIELVRK